MESPEELLTIALSLLYSRFTIMATLVVAILEYLQLFESEKKCMWPTKWHMTKLLFFTSRYLPFVYTPIFVFTSFARGDYSPRTCTVAFAIGTVALIFGVLVADAVLYLRIYAISGGNRTMKFVLIGNYTAVAVACTIGIALFLKAQNFITPPPFVGGGIACFGLVGAATRFGATLCYGFLLYSSMFTMSLSVWYGIRLYMTIRPMPVSGLIKIFYRDGVLYFVIIGVLSVTNACMSLFTGPGTYYAYTLATPQAASHSIIVARMILHLRGVAEEDLYSTDRHSTSIYFARSAH